VFHIKVAATWESIPVSVSGHHQKTIDAAASDLRHIGIIQ
jgi:hypothetical protein